MKLPSISSIIHDKRGEIGTIAVLIGMVVIGLGILVGSQLRNQNINIAPRASEPTADALWSQIKPGPNNIYPWSTINGVTGPTTGWESYYGNRVYICNGEFCWEIIRDGGTTTIGNGGAPTQLSQNASYINAKPAGDIYPWSTINGITGPTAAWTWIVPFNNKTVNETVLCNQNWCWRYIRTSDNVGSGLRDDGKPVYLPTGKVNVTDQINTVWSDSRVASLWTGNGLTTAWSDTVNGYVTLCNGTDCRSLDYKTWTWRYDGAKIAPIPAGKAISQVSAAWTSPVTNTLTQCSGNICYEFKDGSYSSSPIMIAAPTNTVAPTVNQCPAGQLNCSGVPNQCTNVTNNAQHCGACGRACAQGQVCSNSTCVVPSPTIKQCAAGQLLCANNCTTVSNNAQNCGACGRACAQGQVCSNSACIVAPATRLPAPVLTCTNLAGGVRYNWNAVSGANNYNLEVTWTNTGGDSQQGIFNGDVGNINTKTIESTNYGANFQARIIAKNGTNSSLVSNTVNCTVIQPSGNIKVTIPSAPSGAQWRTLNINDRATAWRNSGQTEPRLSLGYYKIEFKDISGFTKPTTLTGVTVLNGNTTEKISAVYVALPTPTCIPSLVSPANNLSITTNPSFQWSTCPGTGTKYRIEVTGNATPNTVNFVGTSYSFTNPVPWTAGKTYTWKVKACPNADCIGGTFSTTRTFTYSPVVNTQAPANTIGPVTLSSPINSAVVPRGNVILQWSAATNATSYDWKISRTTQNYKTGTSTGTSAVASLIPGSYRWQVTAKGTSGTRDSSFGEFKIPFSKIKPLNNTQIVFGSTYSFEWTPLLSTDMSSLNFAIYNSTNNATPVYFKQMSTSSSEYLSGRLSLILNATTDADFVLGQSYTWQLVASRAGASQENTPPNDATGPAQSFSLVAAPTNIVPTAGTTTAPTTRPTTASTIGPTIPVATATITPSCPKRAQGDAGGIMVGGIAACDGIINYIDFVCWKGELSRNKPTNCISSDFDNSGAIDSVDYNLWRNTVITSLNPIP